MQPVSTGALGEISSDTLFTFAQRDQLIHARYAGGTVRLGFLVGTRTGNRLAWRYAQVERAGRLDGGHSLCELSALRDGRIRLTEQFTGESRSGSGTNLLEQIASAGSTPAAAGPAGRRPRRRTPRK
jgi:hypothetical protein